MSSKRERLFAALTQGFIIFEKSGIVAISGYAIFSLVIGLTGIK